MKKVIISFLAVTGLFVLTNVQAATVFFQEALKLQVFNELSLAIVMLTVGPIILLLMLGASKLATTKA